MAALGTGVLAVGLWALLTFSLQAYRQRRDARLAAAAFVIGVMEAAVVVMLAIAGVFP